MPGEVEGRTQHQLAVRRKYHPMPPVAEVLLRLAGTERVSAPFVATNVRSYAVYAAAPSGTGAGSY